MRDKLLATRPIDVLSEKCASETERFFDNGVSDARFCFELFRRAILQKDARAWDVLYQQYRPLVIRWVYRHPAFSSTSEEADFFVDRAFGRMWQALTPEKFQRFDNLKGILRYLQTCVHSAINDNLRKQTLQQLSLEAENGIENLLPSRESVEKTVIEEASRIDLWTEINACLRDDAERCVIYDAYALGFKPREIYQRHQNMFTSVRDVYRIKENILARLRRDKQLQSRLRHHAGKRGN